MYSRSAWGGAVDPFMLVTFPKNTEGDSVISLIMYDWRDFKLIGRQHPGNAEEVRTSRDHVVGYIC
jgi:hypothetical protein